MYRQFNIHKFYVLPTQCTYVCILCGSENKQQLFQYTTLTDWFVLYNQESVYCAVRTEYLTEVNFSLRKVNHFTQIGSSKTKILLNYI